MFTEIDESIKAVKRLKNKLTKENLWLYILRLLQEKPRYGYEIKAEIKNRFKFSPAIVTGYVILYKMKREGLVSERWGEKNNNRPDRKYYVITEKGLTALKKAKELIKALLDNIFDKV
ncbi:MAG: PadR family transcriptional regulator [Candidatus Odinarchaeia archaeon]